MSKALPVYTPRTPHKPRPGHLHALIKQLASEAMIKHVIEQLLLDCRPSPEQVIKYKLYCFIESSYKKLRDRSSELFKSIYYVLSAMLDNCQLNKNGLIATISGSEPGTGETIYLPITKCERADRTEGSKDYMLGIARMAHRCLSTTYWVLSFLLFVGLIVHDGFDIVKPKGKEKPIRISRYCIPWDILTWLYEKTGLSSSHKKRLAKAIAKIDKRKGHENKKHEDRRPAPTLYINGVPVDQSVSDYVAMARGPAKPQGP